MRCGDWRAVQARCSKLISCESDCARSRRAHKAIACQRSWLPATAAPPLARPKPSDEASGVRALGCGLSSGDFWRDTILASDSAHPARTPSPQPSKKQQVLEPTPTTRRPSGGPTSPPPSRPSRGSPAARATPARRRRRGRRTCPWRPRGLTRAAGSRSPAVLMKHSAGRARPMEAASVLRGVATGRIPSYLPRTTAAARRAAAARAAATHTSPASSRV